MLHSCALSSSSIERVQPILDKGIQQRVNLKGYIDERNAFH
jgi:hypothetical protein